RYTSYPALSIFDWNVLLIQDAFGVLQIPCTITTGTWYSDREDSILIEGLSTSSTNIFIVLRVSFAELLVYAKGGVYTATLRVTSVSFSGGLIITLEFCDDGLVSVDENELNVPLDGPFSSPKRVYFTGFS